MDLYSLTGTPNATILHGSDGFAGLSNVPLGLASQYAGGGNCIYIGFSSVVFSWHIQSRISPAGMQLTGSLRSYDESHHDQRRCFSAV